MIETNFITESILITDKGKNTKDYLFFPFVNIKILTVVKKYFFCN